MAAPTIAQPRADGYSDGAVTFQGTRTYDVDSAQWTTPDAFAGVADDPRTQQPYMWNNNNPYSYSDPTGYFPSNIGQVHDGKFYGFLDTEESVLGSFSQSFLTSFDRVLLQNGSMFGYSSGNAAAFAAGTAYATEANGIQVEYGATIYEQDGKFGYGSANKRGTWDNVDWSAPHALDVPAGAQLVGIWHSHPYRDQTKDHSGDLRQFREDYSGTPFTYWTTVEGDLVSQSIDAQGNIGEYITLCTACQPMSLLNEAP
jgi:hypothetical protein